MPAFVRSYGARLVISFQPSEIVPAFGGCSPTIVCSSVLLPTPLRPMRQHSPPSGTSSEIPKITCVGP